jgi:hypothetical protein
MAQKQHQSGDAGVREASGELLALEAAIEARETLGAPARHDWIARRDQLRAEAPAAPPA